MSVKQNWCPKLHTINHVHQAYQNTFEAQFPNTNICNGIFHISFFKALLINEGETTRGERE
jgi:hypothetical protein